MKKISVLAFAVAAAGFASVASAQIFAPYPYGAPPQVPNIYGQPGEVSVLPMMEQRRLLAERLVAVQNWQSLGLYAPPVGYQWYQYPNTNNYALVQLATGVISQLFTR